MAIFKAKITGSKKHIDGAAVTGGHGQVVEGVADIIKKWSKYSWFHNLQPGEIDSSASVGGGKKLFS